MPKPITACPDPTSRSYRVFPGWWMLVVAAVVQYMSGPGQSYSVAAFKDPMQGALGISDTSLSLAYGFATLLSGLSLPFVGRLIDRVGARRVLPVVAGVLGMACLWMSQVASLPGLYLGFGLIRCFGQGALMLTSMWIVGEWFEKRRGVAASLVGLGSSFSVMSIPLVNHFCISHYGWQTAWIVLAFAVWIGVIPAVLFVLRDRPEDLGLQPDGGRSNVQEATLTDGLPTVKRAGLVDRSKSALPNGDWTVGDVLRDVAFWKLLTVPASCGMIVTALTFHQVSILGSCGVEPGWALGLISLQALVATLCAIPAGWLTDRIPGRHLLAVAMVLLASAAMLVLYMPVPQLAVLYAAILGLNGAILRTAGSVIWLNYYGRGNQGGIRGLVMSAMVLGAAVGPLPAAFSLDYLGSYYVALWSFVGISVFSGVAAWTARPRFGNG